MNRLRRELPLLLAALFVAFVIWLIAMQGDRESSWVTVPFRLEKVPENLVVTSVTPRVPAVQLNVQFPKEQRSRIVDKNFVVTLPVADMVSNDPEQWTDPNQARTIPYYLTVPNNVSIHGLPPDVHVVTIDPERIDLEVKLRTLELTVEIPTTGKLASQYQLTDKLLPQPATVIVTGSEKKLAVLSEHGRKIATHPVDLSTIKVSGQIMRELVIPDAVQLVNQSDARVAVNVGLQERSIFRTFPSVPIALPVLSPNLQARIDPPAADIRVEGPPSLLNQVTPDCFVFAPVKSLEEKAGRTQEVGLEVSFRTRVSPEFSRRLKITEVNPPRISVEFVSANGHNAKRDSVR